MVRLQWVLVCLQWLWLGFNCLRLGSRGPRFGTSDSPPSAAVVRVSTVPATVLALPGFSTSSPMGCGLAPSAHGMAPTVRLLAGVQQSSKWLQVAADPGTVPASTGTGYRPLVKSYGCSLLIAELIVSGCRRSPRSRRLPCRPHARYQTQP